MGCNSSKLDDEEAVQLCKDRKKFIKQAVEHRLRFAAGHLAYIQSLKRVSAALRDYIEGDEPREFLLDSFITPPYTPVKRSAPRFITIAPNCHSETPTIQQESNTSMKISYYRPSGNPPVSVEERPQSPDTFRVQSYPSMYNYGIDGFFTMQSPSQDPSSYSYSPNNRPTIPPPSPQTNQWDFFWNPFSSLDYYGYPTRSSLDQSVIDDDINGLRQVREEEGIPELEEETEHEEVDSIGSHDHAHGHTHVNTRAHPHTQPHARAPAHSQPHARAPAHSQPHARAPAHSQPHARAPAYSQPPARPPAHSQPHARAPAKSQPHARALANSQPHARAPAQSQPHARVPAESQPHARAPAHSQPHGPAHPHARAPTHPYPQPHHLYPQPHDHARASHPHARAYAQERQERATNLPYSMQEEVTVEDVDEDDDDDEEDEMISADESENEGNGTPCNEISELSQPPQAQQVEIHHQENAVGECETKEETPGFTVYVNKRPTSMDEVIKDLETQFVIVCNSAKEVSALLESNHAQYLSASHEISPGKLLNPVALFRSGSSRSSSSRFLVSSSSSREEGYESSSSFSTESCMLSGSHQSTLDRLYAWEKRLYEEVRSGERIRLAYEKKCKQLRNQDAKGEDPTSVNKTRAVIRDLHTQIKVAIHSIEAISKRIETLRDEELHPQLLELVQGLARMWKVMAECHQMQKRTLDDAKLLLAGTPSKFNKGRRHSAISATTIDPNRLTRSASKLESELRNWKACFESWVTSQRSYVDCLASWLLRCMRCEPDTSKLPFSPRHSSAAKLAPPIFGLCIQWSRFMDTLHEVPVLDGLDFFAAGMGSIYAQQAREDSRRAQCSSGSKRFNGNTDVVEYRAQEEEESMTPEKMAEVAVRVLCAGMSVAMSSLTEFAICSAEGYAELVNHWENVKWPPPPLTSNGEQGT